MGKDNICELRFCFGKTKIEDGAIFEFYCMLNEKRPELLTLAGASIKNIHTILNLGDEYFKNRRFLDYTSLGKADWIN